MRVGAGSLSEGEVEMRGAMVRPTHERVPRGQPVDAAAVRGPDQSARSWVLPVLLGAVAAAVTTALDVAWPAVLVLGLAVATVVALVPAVVGRRRRRRRR